MQLLYSFVVRLVRGLLTFIPLSGKTKQFVEGRNTFGMTLKNSKQQISYLDALRIAWRV